MITQNLGHTDVIKELAPFSKTPNAPNDTGFTPMHYAAMHGFTDIVKVLAPFFDIHNSAHQNNRRTRFPIHLAASKGHLNVIKILAPLMDNPNAPDCVGENPIILAAENGHVEVIKFLAPLTNNPNAPNIYGETPISIATEKGYTNIVKVLNDALDEQQKLKQEKEVENNDKKVAKNLQQKLMQDDFGISVEESIPLDLVGNYIQIDPSHEDEEENQDDRIRQLPILKRARFNREYN